MRLALIDGDPLVYSSGFASDAAAKAEVMQRTGMKTKEEWDEYVAANGKPHEPLRFAIHGLKMQIESVVEAAEADDYVIYLSHPVNFRESFFPDYKQNRDPTHKPFWGAEIADYLLNNNAVYSELGDEADDALGMAQVRATSDKRETIICTIDKDLDMIPGLHYNFSKTKKADGIYRIEDPEGLRLFYAQMIQGDSSDNIPGLYKKRGIKASARYFYPLEGMTTHAEMYRYVLDVYEGDTEFVNLNGKLLWIKREPKWYEAPILEKA